MIDRRYDRVSAPLPMAGQATGFDFQIENQQSNSWKSAEPFTFDER